MNPHPTSKGTPGGLAAIRVAGRRAVQWRLLLWCAILLIPTALLAMPFWQLLSAQLSNSMYAAEFATGLSALALGDLVGAVGQQASSFGTAQWAALVLTLLFSPLLTGLVIAAARPAQTLPVAGLLQGGAAEYARLLRMQIWSVVPLGLAVGIGAGGFYLVGKLAEKATLESSADSYRWLALGVTAIVFLLIHATLDAGRAALAIYRHKTSAVKAWWRGCKLVCRQPRAMLGGYLAITLFGLAIAALLSLLRINVPHANVAGFAGALLLTQLVVATLAWMRSARLFALIDISRANAA